MLHMETVTLAPNAILVYTLEHKEDGTVEHLNRLFSYDTHIITVEGNEGIVEVTHYWDYSNTTSKHLNLFLQEVGLYDEASLPRAQKRKLFEEKGLI